VELFVYGTGLSHWCCHVHEFNKWVMVQQWCGTLFYSHCDFLFCKHNCISYVWLEIFGRGSL